MWLVSNNILLNCIVITITVTPTLVTSAEPKLKLLNVVFRHGDRSPADDGKEFYPNDPYLNYTFPMGYGQLTNNGKTRSYKLGLYLRKVYNEFLEDYYVPEEVYARSTDFDRTKMSLQLVLSSIYPPKDHQRWNPNLDWQPIPTIYYSSDPVLRPELLPESIAEVQKVMQRPEVMEKIHAYDGLMKNLTELTGKSINTVENIFDLQNTLLAESSMGLELPSWTEGLFPSGLIIDGTLLFYEISHYSPRLRQLRSGLFLQEVTKNMMDKIDNSTNDKKIHLYSAHETNVASTLINLGLFAPPHVPQYSSAVIIELLNLDDKYYVRIRYYKGVSGESTIRTIPGCEELCPLEEFIKLINNDIPSTIQNS